MKQSGDVLKSKIDEEVHNTVTRMGFIKRDEFDELRAEFNEFKRIAKDHSVKSSGNPPKKTTVKKTALKKATAQKKRKS
jgi:hypothetical protein